MKIIKTCQHDSTNQLYQHIGTFVGPGIPERHILALQGCYELVSQEEANIHGNGRDKRIAIQDTEVKEGFQFYAR